MSNLAMPVIQIKVFAQKRMADSALEMRHIVIQHRRGRNTGSVSSTFKKLNLLELALATVSPNLNKLFGLLSFDKTNTAIEAVMSLFMFVC